MLSIIATPVGNLGDITVRAMQTLLACDFIICEDTRTTGQLLQLLKLPKKELVSFHGYSKAEFANSIVARLHSEHGCLVSDAGTPGISDPGYVITSKAREANIHIEALPGASAFLVALSMSGLPINQFTYLGFLPLKKGRKTLLTSLIVEEKTIIFYESVHRIQKTLSELCMYFADSPNRTICIGRELTKKHEEMIVTTIAKLPETAKKITCKGEFVVIIGAKERGE